MSHLAEIEQIAQTAGKANMDIYGRMLYAPYFEKRLNEIGYEYNFGGTTLDSVPDAQLRVLKKGVDGKIRAELFVFR